MLASQIKQKKRKSLSMKTVIRDSSVSENGFTLRYLLFEVAENGRTDYLFNVEIHSDRVDDAEQVSDV